MGAPVSAPSPVAAQRIYPPLEDSSASGGLVRLRRTFRLGGFISLRLIYPPQADLSASFSFQL